MRRQRRSIVQRTSLRSSTSTSNAGLFISALALLISVCGISLNLSRSAPQPESIIVTPTEEFISRSVDYSVTPLEATTPWTRRIEYIKQVLTIKANQRK